MLVRLVPVGFISEGFLQEICRELQSSINVKCKLLSKIGIFDSAFNQLRRQYDAGKMIDKIAKMSEAKFIDRTIPTLAITEEDIYYNGLNFVFSVEEPAKACSIISIARLKPEFYGENPNNRITVDRTVKECIHEIGHHLGLKHCRHVFCIMSFPASVKDIDNKRREFCSSCNIQLAMKGINIELI